MPVFQLPLLFLKIIFKWTISKIFTEFVRALLLFYVFGFLGHEDCGILAPQPGIESAPSAFKGKVLTTAPPGKSLHF